MTDIPTFDALIRAACFSLAALAWVVALVRVSGLRSLSKMTAFDFVVTLATGSLLATAAGAATWTTFVQAIAAMTVLMSAQVALAYLRRLKPARRLMENAPLLLIHRGEFREDAMRTGRVTHDDLRAKLRQAGIAGPQEVAFMVLEATGDVSILTQSDIGEKMMSGVRGIDR